MNKIQIDVSPVLRNILDTLCVKGAKTFFVGGTVRDKIMSLVHGVKFDPKDLDVEVHNMSPADLMNALSLFGKVEAVGADFGSIKVWIDGKDFDFTVARREHSVGAGHKNFKVAFDPDMTIEEAASRRDFTINAVMVDTQTGQVHDPFGGIEDIENRVLHPTSTKFVEDRVIRTLRGFQFAGRFNLVAAPNMEARDLMGFEQEDLSAEAQERVRGEVEKWALKSVKPSAGIQFLFDVGVLDLIFPLVAWLNGVPQDRVWHPEGDVFEHTKQVCDAMAWKLNRDHTDMPNNRRVVLMLSALLHDIGKAWTTKPGDDGRWRAQNHAKEGSKPAHKNVSGIFKPPEQKVESRIALAVETLVCEHMSHIGFVGSKRHVRRLMSRLADGGVTMRDLQFVVDADSNGRHRGGFKPERWQANTTMQMMIALMESMDMSPDKGFEPIVKGRDVLPLGIKPGPVVGFILEAAKQAQLDGDFETHEQGVAWLQENVGVLINEFGKTAFNADQNL